MQPILWPAVSLALAWRGGGGGAVRGVAVRYGYSLITLTYLPKALWSHGTRRAGVSCVGGLGRARKNSMPCHAMPLSRLVDPCIEELKTSVTNVTRHPSRPVNSILGIHQVMTF